MLSDEVKEFLAHHSINWASARKPLDMVIELPSLLKNPGQSEHKTKKSSTCFFRARRTLCKVVSAGTDVHELTTMSAFPSICKFLLDSLHSFGLGL